MNNNKIHAKIQAIKDELETEFVERNEEIEGAIVALLSKQHMLMLGNPGTAKSMLTDRLCARIDQAQYFQWLLTKFSTPEELYGVVSLKALENDEYRRITTHKLPEAHIAFLDECFKASSAILNTLLTLINERKFHNNGSPVIVPLQTLIGASNEMPEGEELGAFFDRLMLRYIVKYIAEDNAMKAMLRGTKAAGNTKITLDELAIAQAEVQAIMVSDAILDAIIKIRNNLRTEGVIASDRRYRMSIDILKASAWLAGNKAVCEDDLAILQHVLWSAPTEIKTVQRVVLMASNPQLNKITELLDMAFEVHKNAIEAARDPAKKGAAGMEGNSKLTTILESLNAIKTNIEAAGKPIKAVQDAINKVSAQNKEVLKVCLGVNLD